MSYNRQFLKNGMVEGQVFLFSLKKISGRKIQDLSYGRYGFRYRFCEKGQNMQLQHTDVIDAPLEQVYAIVKDKLPEVVPFLPNIKQIKVLEYKKKDDGKTYVTNQWYAEASVPALVQKFLSEDLFSWKDIAVWDDSKYEVEYSLESLVGKDIYTATGRNVFKACGEGKTELTLTCQIEIYPERIPGVPKLIARKVQPVVEQLIEKMLGPNLTSLGDGIRSYLKSR
jgi:hypothetical protein